jgi:hypothetical protein
MCDRSREVGPKLGCTTRVIMCDRHRDVQLESGGTTQVERYGRSRDVQPELGGSTRVGMFDQSCDVRSEPGCMTRVRLYDRSQDMYLHYKYVQWIVYDMKNVFIVSNKIKGFTNFLLQSIPCINHSIRLYRNPRA